tara:strand:- start:1189 stop:1455 length:267 start_codon:yes stop_codon:yes gene_type:complete
MIKTVVSTYGEFIGDVVEDADIVVVKKPKMVIQSEKGFGFAKGVCVTSEESPEEISIQKTNVVLIVNTHADVVKAYEESVSVIQKINP